LAVVNKASEAHYTEERLTIPETLESRAAIAIQDIHPVNLVKQSQEQMAQRSMATNFTFNLPEPGQAEAGSRVLIP
jgi:hypothetical protein